MDFDTIYNIILTIGVGAISFFLKRSFDKLDSRAAKEDVEKMEAKINSFDDRFASKAELNELKKTIDKISDKIDDIKDSSVRRADFISGIARLDGKLDSLASRRD